MKLNELRKGNLICPINRGGYIHLPMTLIVLKVLTIGIFEVEALPIDKNPVQEENWLKIKSSDISEIPLTKEWLLKFGFDWDGYGEFLKEGLLIDCEYTDKGKWAAMFNMISIPYELEYVHQVQNLYFALYAEELTIKGL